MENTITFDDQKIFFRITGAEKTVVLLHGFLESLEIWDYFVSELSAEFRIISIDLPGHGGSGQLGDVHSMELMAETVIPNRNRFANFTLLFSRYNSF